MKKLFIVLMLLCVAMVVHAQESTPFEGEIVYETYENYSDYLLKMPNSIMVNGVHKIRLILKGDKMHLINEITGCHTIVDNAAAQAIMNDKKNNEARAIVHFCDHTKTGLDMSDAPGVNYILNTRDIAYADGSKIPLVTNTFAKTENRKSSKNAELKVATIARKQQVSIIKQMTNGIFKVYILASCICSTLFTLSCAK